MLRLVTGLLGAICFGQRQTPDPFMDVRTLRVYPPINRQLHVAFKQKDRFEGCDLTFIEVIAVTAAPLVLELLPDGKQVSHTGCERVDSLYIRPAAGRRIKLRTLKPDDGNQDITLLVRYHEPVSVALMGTLLRPDLQPLTNGDMADCQVKCLDYAQWAANNPA